MKDEPAERLDPRARTLWRIIALLNVLPLLAGASLAGWALVRFGGASFPVGALPVLAVLAVAAVVVGVLPGLRWRRWRYEIRREEVDLQRGIFWKTRTLVPLARIQQVDTMQGPLQRRFGLSTLVFHTAAGPNRIPELSAPVATGVRDRIAELTGDDLDL